jgi:hypothetical protein
MTTQPHGSEFVASPSSLFAHARSDWVDSFARLEATVLKCGDRFSAQRAPRGMPFSQRLARMAASTPSTICSRATLEKLQKLIRECETLLPLRATLVHSVMQIGQLGDTDIALFRNGVDAARELPNYVVMTEEDFRRQQRQLQSLRDRFSRLLG